MGMQPSDLPSTKRLEYTAYEPDVLLVRRLLGGTRLMQESRAELAGSTAYVPKWSAEDPTNYKMRATAAKVYGMLARALSASLGMLFAKPLERSEEWPAAIAEDWENIDGRGTHGDVFAKRCARDDLADGLGIILVDHTPAPPGVTITDANAREYNLRPVWARYPRLDAVSWDDEVVNNRRVLTRLNLRESRTTRSGPFGVTSKEVWRVLWLGFPSPMAIAAIGSPDGVPPELGAILANGGRVAWWQVLEEVKEGNATTGTVTGVRELEAGIFRAADGSFFDEIPVAVGYASDSTAPMVADVPLIDLAWCNLEHWRIANDLRWYETLCAFPMPKLRGQLASEMGPDGTPIPGAFKWGPTALVHLEGADSEFEWAELEGSTLERLREALHETKDEGGELGASFLAKKTRGVETAEAKRIDSVAENATLSAAGIGIADQFNEALRLHAKYRGIPAEKAPTLSLNSDFELAQMDAATMTAWGGLAEKLKMPVMVVLEALQEGGRIKRDADLEEIESAIAVAMADAEAAAERQREEQTEALQARGAADGAGVG